MKTFVVIGLGRFGRATAIKLKELGNEVLAIDDDQECIEDVADFVTHAACGDAKDERVLRSLGVENYDCAIVAIGGDLASSIVITLTLREMGMKKIIAKAANDLEKKALEKVGADQVIIPERIMGEKLAQTLSSESFLDFIELSEEYSVVELNAPEEWVGKSLAGLNIRSKYHVNIIGVRSQGKFNVSLTADFTFRTGDIAVVLGDRAALKKIRKL